MENYKGCVICNDKIHFLAKYCKRCRRLIDRVDMRRKTNREARVQALKKAWNGENFRCHYSDIKLVEDNSKDPRYLTFDHRTPRNEQDIVITASIINDMKSDMDEDEFKAVVLQLADG